MQKTLSPSIQTEAPFLDLFSEAEEIKIHEIPREDQTKLASMPDPFFDLSPINDPLHRTFFVQIRAKPAPTVVTQLLEKPSNEDNRAYLLRSAELLLGEEDYVLARNIYSFLLKENDRDADAMHGLGQCFLKLGDIPAAKKCFKGLIGLRNNEECLLWLGHCLVAEGDDNGAIEHFRKVQNPSDLPTSSQFELYKELGNCENRRGNFDNAWTQYHKAMSVQPDSDVIYVNLGTLEIQRHHTEVALSYFSKAIELNPKSSRAQCGLGLVALGKNDIPMAKKAFEHALSLDGQNLVALLQLILLADMSGQFASVKPKILDFLAKDPKNTEVRYRLVVIYFKEKDWSNCQRELDTILFIDPIHSKAKALRLELNANKHFPA